MKHILFLAHRAPFPPDRGDKIRSYHILKHLAARARVHCVAFAEELADRTPPADLAVSLASMTIVPRGKSRALAAVQALASGRAVSLAAFADVAMAQAVARVLADHPIDAIYVFSGQMAQYVPADAPPFVMDFVDVDSAKFAGYSARGPFALRWLMRREARLLGAFERGIAARAAASVFVSEAEAALFRAEGGRGRIEAVENGIDTHVYDPAAAEPVATQGPLVVFTGQMDYPPNVDAVVRFVGEILPRLRAADPALRFAIVGRSPTTAVRALAGEGVIVTGAVPDVRGWLAAADVCVAPLAIARGIQNKVLEAMAMARPVVASDAAAEGIGHAGTIREADGADAWVAAITALLADRSEAERLGAAARERVSQRYAWEARLAPLDALLGLAA